MTQGPPRDVGPARLEAVVYGRVQGVGFRWFVRQEAGRLKVAGWVSNRADGSVEVVAEGPTAALETLAERIAVGPPGSAVRDVDLRWGAATGEFEGFAIRSGSHSGD